MTDGSTLVILMLLVVAGRTHGVSGHRAYIASGILVSIAAAGVQQSGIRLHRHFNHNDLMHVVQMGGMWLLSTRLALAFEIGTQEDLMAVSRRGFLKASGAAPLSRGRRHSPACSSTTFTRS